MYEKLIKCAAKIMLCLLKDKKQVSKFKAIFQVSGTHEMKNRILS